MVSDKLPPETSVRWAAGQQQRHIGCGSTVYAAGSNLRRCGLMETRHEENWPRSVYVVQVPH